MYLRITNIKKKTKNYGFFSRTWCNENTNKSTSKALYFIIIIILEILCNNHEDI